MHLDLGAPTVKLLNTLWSYIRKLLGIRGFLTHTPLWRNRQYREIPKLRGFKNWEELGIKYVSQLFNGLTLKSFTVIQGEFEIPRTNFYKYLQLWHAIQTQARTTKLQYTDHILIQSIIMEKDKKGMISRCYNTLLNQLQDSSKLPCRQGWENDVGTIGGEDWDLCLSAAPLLSVSASQRLSHLYLLYRAYRTPLQLHKRGLRDSPLFPKCERDNGDLLHMLWKCPKLFRCWREIIDTESRVYMTSIPHDPVIYLLGA